MHATVHLVEVGNFVLGSTRPRINLRRLRFAPSILGLHGFLHLLITLSLVLFQKHASLHGRKPEARKQSSKTKHTRVIVLVIIPCRTAHSQFLRKLLGFSVV